MLLIPALFPLPQSWLAEARPWRRALGRVRAAHPTRLGPTASLEQESRRERWEQRQQWRRQRPRRLHQRSVSKEKWVETLVVADAKMVEYHGQPHVESYVLTIMNMVGLLWGGQCGRPGAGSGEGSVGAGQRAGQGRTPPAWARPGPPSLPVHGHDCLSKDSL